MSVGTEIKLLESTTFELEAWMDDLENEVEMLDPDVDSDFPLHVRLLAEIEDVRGELTRRREDPELDLEVSAPVQLTVQEKYLALFA